MKAFLADASNILVLGFEGSIFLPFSAFSVLKQELSLWKRNVKYLKMISKSDKFLMPWEL